MGDADHAVLDHRKLARRGDDGLDVVDVGGGLRMVKAGRAQRRMAEQVHVDQLDVEQADVGRVRADAL